MTITCTNDAIATSERLLVELKGLREGAAPVADTLLSQARRMFDPKCLLAVFEASPSREVALCVIHHRLVVGAGLEELARHELISVSTGRILKTYDERILAVARDWPIFWTDVDDLRIELAVESATPTSIFVEELLSVVPWVGEGATGLAQAASKIADGPLAERFSAARASKPLKSEMPPRAPLAIEKSRMRWSSRVNRQPSAERVADWIRANATNRGLESARFDLAADSLPKPDAKQASVLISLGQNSAVELRILESDFLIQVAIDPSSRIGAAPRLLDGDFRSLDAELHGDGLWWFRLGTLQTMRPAYVLELELDGETKLFEFF